MERLRVFPLPFSMRNKKPSPDLSNPISSNKKTVMLLSLIYDIHSTSDTFSQVDLELLSSNSISRWPDRKSSGSEIFKDKTALRLLIEWIRSSSNVAPLSDLPGERRWTSTVADVASDKDDEVRWIADWQLSSITRPASQMQVDRKGRVGQKCNSYTV